MMELIYNLIGYTIAGVICFYGVVILGYMFVYTIGGIASLVLGAGYLALGIVGALCNRAGLALLAIGFVIWLATVV